MTMLEFHILNFIHNLDLRLRDQNVFFLKYRDQIVNI
jgi:hypothetical protein